MSARHSDEYLRHQALKLRDPFAQPGLTWHIPENAVFIDILNIYNFERWPREKACCVKCGRRNHKKGFTALLVSGERLILGSKCGAELFGESWAEAERRIEERGDRQYEVLKLDRLALVAKPLREGLLSWSSIMESIGRRRDGFDNSLGELASRTREAANRGDGALTVTRRVQLNIARQAGMRASDYAEVRVGSLAGGGVFAMLGPHRAVTGAIEALDEMRAGIGSTNGTATSELNRRRRNFDRALEKVEAAARLHEAAQEFFTLRNFRGLLAWANDHGATQARYAMSDDGVVQDVATKRGIRVSPIPDLSDEPVELIREYRRAD